MKILITGANGQLAKEFIRVLEKRGMNFVSFTKQQLDITDFYEVLNRVKRLKPQTIINCGAYNQVDRAEEEFEKALYVNHQGVMNLAIASSQVKSMLVHYSTDYVFDGEKRVPYTEQDTPNPLNRYALSKYLGELSVKRITDRYLIFRVSWVYGEGTQNFLYKLGQWVKEREYLKIACDEFSVPTSTRTIVEVSLKAFEQGLTGLYHLTNSGYASRYEWAKEYLKIKGINEFIYPAYRSEFNLPARRPGWSVMSNENLSGKLNISIETWDTELRKFFMER